MVYLCLVSTWLQLLVLAIGLAEAYDLVADLGYGTFQGAYNAEYNISYWQKIPFAAPPIGENRFRAPQPPLPITNGVYNSSQPFDMCPQRTVNGSEDCLHLGLYSRPWTRGAPLRPVVVTFFGGGFVQGSASFTTLPPPAYPILNVSASTDIVFVYPNYRTNAFGFLPGRQVAADDARADANAGLLDQRAALLWARDHIARFGGDPARVTIWGQSAGGGSVLAQVIAAARRDPSEPEPERLFRRALASSPFWPKTYHVDAPEAQERYDRLAELAGCAPASVPDSLGCLKAADVQTIRNASLAVVDDHKYDTSTFGWGPVIDGAFLPGPLSKVVTRGDDDDIGVQFGFGMYNTHEGESFVPPGLKDAEDTGSPPLNSSVASFDEWLAGYLPRFSDEDLARVKEFYPEVGQSELITGYNASFTRAGLIYRDSVLACPAYWMAGAAPEGGWLGEYTISPAQHASDVYWWNTVNSAQEMDALHYEGYAGAMASFFMTGDPNALKIADGISGVPALSTGEEFVINSEGFTTIKLNQFTERCGLWKEIAPKIPI
ncbi:carboxylesterase [Xylariaceae sp. FL0662B]|nr:carboxylesterase [Xylariaceae sp. FL0662B]